MIPYRLSLDYTLHPGWLEPFVEGLRAGQAVARRCADCGRVSFPPVRICDCGSVDGEWVALSGRAIIRARTTGADGDFALVQFVGADTSAVVRLLDMPEGATEGQLAASDHDLPQLCLGPVDGGQSA